MVSLDVYKVPKEDLCGIEHERVGLLTYKNQAYRYQDCFSYSMDDDGQGTSFILNYQPNDHHNQQLVHGAAELAANGPGRKVYYVYDGTQDRWFGLRIGAPLR
ncbi:hypothetical protein SY83_05430 [Paenibacillus swuensis]|uniref:Uncharacterized protein n=1 Tax=Paenibacillus swuensis TaxID=1178515 RepID=A0A172TFJ7_9BACL|nr:hypothetical protein SY83_05430 [Paenibacillus swuensis]